MDAVSYDLEHFERRPLDFDLDGQVLDVLIDAALADREDAGWLLHLYAAGATLVVCRRGDELIEVALFFAGDHAENARRRCRELGVALEQPTAAELDECVHTVLFASLWSLLPAGWN